MPQLSDFSVHHNIFTPNRVYHLFFCGREEEKWEVSSSIRLIRVLFFCFQLEFFSPPLFSVCPYLFSPLVLYSFFSLPAQLSRLIRKLTSLTKVTRLCELNGRGPDMLVFTRPKIPNLLMLPPYNY